jgi:hypothetical protein
MRPKWAAISVWLISFSQCGHFMGLSFQFGGDFGKQNPRPLVFLWLRPMLCQHEHGEGFGAFELGCYAFAQGFVLGLG